MIAAALAPHPIRQLTAHLRARPQPAPAWLNAAEAALFRRMPAADQMEGLAVVDTLRSWGYEADRSLLVAGLLHDAGKCMAPTGAVYRMAFSILELAPSKLRNTIANSIGALKALSEHPRSGAELAAAAGLAEDVVALIRHHHSPSADPRMQALQRADELH